MHSLKRITPNKQRAKSLYSMAKQTEEMLLQTHKKYASIKKKNKKKKKKISLRLEKLCPSFHLLLFA